MGTVSLKSGKALVVGGTGMLRDATLALAADGWELWAVARNRTRLDEIATEAARDGGIIHPVPVDYRRDSELTAAIEKVVSDSGGLDMTVCWIHQHSAAPRAPAIVGRTVARSVKPFDYYDIIGSGDDASNKMQVDIEREQKSIPSITYHRIVLGSRIEINGRRWLTHYEISQGVLNAVRTGVLDYRVGDPE